MRIHYCVAAPSPAAPGLPYDRDDMRFHVSHTHTHHRWKVLAFACLTAVALAVSGCSIQITSQPDPSIGEDTMLINADKGNPLFDRNFNPYMTNTRTASRWIYEPLILINPLDGTEDRKSTRLNSSH